MEPARIVQLHPVAAPQVRVDGDRIVVDHLALTEPALARFLAAKDEDARLELVERALRIGLLAVQDAGTSLDVELVRREFEALLHQADALNERAAKELDGLLRTNFADGDGRSKAGLAEVRRPAHRRAPALPACDVVSADNLSAVKATRSTNAGSSPAGT